MAMELPEIRLPKVLFVALRNTALPLSVMTVPLVIPAAPAPPLPPAPDPKLTPLAPFDPASPVLFTMSTAVPLLKMDTDP